MARIGAITCAFVITAAALAAAAPFTKRPQGSAARAGEWVDAVLSHEPGSRDAAFTRVSSWPSNAVIDVLIELASIRHLMRDPRTRAFEVPEELDGGRATEILYSGGERDALEQAGLRAARQGFSDADLVARGIVLHSDIALLSNQAGDWLEFTDGQHMELQRGRVDHLRIARMLGNTLDRKSGRDADLASWYEASIATLVARGKWNTTHTSQALSRFPDDPELRFLAGCEHETFAAAPIQSSIPNSRLPPGMRIPVGSRSRELDEAAAQLKRALVLSPGHTEARVHYGHVLMQTGRTSQAIMELRGAAATARDPRLQYYAQLFLGAALEETGQREEARYAYGTAAQLFPRAQSPRLALSALAASSGRRAEAITALVPMLALPPNEQDRTDPWWTYIRSYGHDADALMAAAIRRLAVPRGRSAP